MRTGNAIGMAFGGLLKGFGDGLVAQAKEDRDKALRQMEIDAADRRQQTQIAADDSRLQQQQSFEAARDSRARTAHAIERTEDQFNETVRDQNRRKFEATQKQMDRDAEAARDQRRFENEKNIIEKYEPDETGEMVGYYKGGGKPFKTGITGIPKDLSVGEKAAVTMAGQMFVTKDPIEGTKVDKAGMAEFLRNSGTRMGSKALVSMADGIMPLGGDEDRSLTTAANPAPGQAKAAEPKGSPRPAATDSSLPKASSPADVEKMAPGTKFIAPDGSVRTKPAAPSQDQPTIGPDGIPEMKVDARRVTERLPAQPYSSASAQQVNNDIEAAAAKIAQMPDAGWAKEGLARAYSKQAAQADVIRELENRYSFRTYDEQKDLRNRLSAAIARIRGR